MDRGHQLLLVTRATHILLIGFLVMDKTSERS